MTSALKMAHGRCSKLILIFGHGNDLHVHIIMNISVHRVLCEVLVDIDVGNSIESFLVLELRLSVGL